MQNTVVVWLKRDLRLRDHPALVQANQRAVELGGSLLVLYVYEPVLLKAPDFDSRHLTFINDCLEELDETLRDLGSRLVTRSGKVRKVLSELYAEAPFAFLYSHEEAGHQETYDRDLAVAQWCQSQGVVWKECVQNGVVRGLRSRDGWAKRWAKRMNTPCLEAPFSLAETPPKIASDGILDSAYFGFTPAPPEIQKGGTREGRRWLKSFLQERGQNYTRAMSSPVTGFTECSRVSPYLSWGALSIREVHHAAMHRSTEIKWSQKQAQTKEEKGEWKDWAQALRSFSGRLRWHCHFMQKLEDLPTIHERNFARIYDGLREEHWNDTYYQAWVEGKTGYPLVDACMRAVAATGYLNFRMRAMVMSFASYHLWLHWRETGLHLARMFTDYEPGIHWSQVQMQSGTTGINAVRVYSPIKQTVDQDPEGVFIKQWVPELQGLPVSYLAEPWTTPEMEQAFAHCLIGQDYPAPIVDHKTAYRYAQDTIRGLRKTDPAKQEASKIHQKHGSRKKPRAR